MPENLKLLVFLLLGLLLSASQCTSLTEKNALTASDRIDLNDDSFAEDTLQVLEYHRLASSYLYEDAEKAMSYSKHVLRLSQKHNWNKGKLLAYNLLSTYYLLDGSYDILRELSNETFVLSEELHLPVYEAHAKRFLAESYSEYRQWDSAKANYDQALHLFTKLGEDSAKATLLENIGNSFREKDRYDVADDYYNQADRVFKKIGSEWGQATVLQAKGYAHVRQKEYELGEQYFKKALALFEKLNNRYGQLNALNDLGNTYFYMRRFDESIEVSLKALEYSKLYHSIQQNNWALRTLVNSYKGKNMFKEALHYSEQFIHNRRMTHEQYVFRQYTMYQLMYDNKQKDTEIQTKELNQQKFFQYFLSVFSLGIIAFASMLWFNNKKLRKKNAEIREALIQGQTMERKRVAAELHDHLGGTLASLNWYMYGIDKKLLSVEEQKIYESVHQMVGSAYREVRSLSHNLMPAELEEHGLIMALSRLTGKLNENKNIEFTFNYKGFEHRLNNKVEFELYSIVLELTNNIIKHASASLASVELMDTSRFVKMVISDNGTGMVNSSKQGIGLGNVRNRVQSLQGKIEISNADTNGTKIEIEIPKTVAGKISRT